MKRILAATVLLGGLIVGLIAWRLRLQAAALQGPPVGSGTIEGTSLRVAARVASRVAEALVRRGDSVRAGQALLRMDCAEPRAALAEAEARLEAARAQVTGAAAQSQAAGRAHAAAVSSAEAARGSASAVAVQRDAAERERRRAQSLGSSVPTATVDQASSAADALARQAAGSAASSEALSLQARAAAAQAQASRAQVEVARRNVDALVAAASRARVQVGECEVRAPRDAVVEDVYWEAGELPPPGATLVELVDLSALEATFYLPNADIGRARNGARAVVEADAFPGERFEAAVVSVSAVAEFTPRNIQTRTDRDRLVYPIVVRLARADGRLRPGMPVQVTLPGAAR